MQSWAIVMLAEKKAEIAMVITFLLSADTRIDCLSLVNTRQDGRAVYGV